MQKLLIPPPLVGVMVVLLMWGTNRLVANFQFDFVGREVLALLFLVLGLVFDIAAILAFRAASTTVNPLAPDRASSIVATGPFRFSRNPMYLGMLLILTAWGFWLGNSINALWLIAFVIVITWLQIKPEEAALADKFGEQYLDYQSQVRRWI